MFCPNCGNQVPDTAAFCTKCGTRTSQQAAGAQPSQPQPQEQRMIQPASRDEMLAAQKQAYTPPPGGAPPQAQQYQQFQQPAGSFNPSECLSLGWNAVKSCFGGFIVGTIVYIIISCAVGFIPGASLILGGVLAGGYYIFCFRGMDNGNTEIGDLFKGFSRFIQLLLVYVVSAVIIGVGLVLLVIPGIYLAICYSFAIQLVVDQNLDFWTAMETSRKTVAKCWGSVFVLCILFFVVALLGTLALGVGIIVAIPVIMCAKNYAYTQLFQRMNQLP